MAMNNLTFSSNVQKQTEQSWKLDQKLDQKPNWKDDFRNALKTKDQLERFVEAPTTAVLVPC